MTYFFKVYTFENTDTSNEHKNFIKKNSNHEKNDTKYFCQNRGIEYHILKFKPRDISMQSNISIRKITHA
jgi:hypothetical protein